MSTSPYLPPGCDDADPRAPWNLPDEPEARYCDWCDLTPVEGGTTTCDACLVANAESCGDWDDESRSARERRKPAEVMTPTRRYFLAAERLHTAIDERKPERVRRLRALVDHLADEAREALHGRPYDLTTMFEDIARTNEINTTT